MIVVVEAELLLLFMEVGLVQEGVVEVLALRQQLEEMEEVLYGAEAVALEMVGLALELVGLLVMAGQEAP
jgi:hypothetical protein